MSAKVESTTNLTELGIDSLMIAKFSSILTDALDIRLLPTVFFEYPNIHEISYFLVQRYESKIQTLFEFGEVKKEETTNKTTEDFVQNYPAETGFDDLWASAKSEGKTSNNPDWEFKIYQIFDFELATYQSGTGSPVLFIGGLGNTFEDWRNILDMIRQKNTVLFIDLPGHGSSTITNSRIDIFEIGKAIEQITNKVFSQGPIKACGYSLGGSLLQAILLKNPTAFKSIVLISTTPLNIPIIDLMKKLASELIDLEQKNESLILIPKNIIDFKVIQKYADMFKNLDSIVMPEILTNVKVNFIVGDEDKTVEPYQINILKRLFPELTVTMIPKYGHYLPWSNQVEFCKILEPIFDTNDAS